MPDAARCAKQGGEVLAVLAPGQGSQKAGLLDPWLTLPGVRERAASLSRAAGIDLVEAGTELSDDAVTDTAVAQPLIVATGLLTAGLLPALPDATVTAGHSIGEFTAGCLAGAFTETDALSMVGVRGRAMADAAQRHPGGMVAVLGGDPGEVDRAITAAGCIAANHNAPDQVVAAGSADAVRALLGAPPPRARMRPLSVAGAFHTDLMADAVEPLREAAAAVTAAAATYGVLSNRDGTLVTDGDDLLGRLVEQVRLPVRWHDCVRTMQRLGVTGVVELAPGGTLTALVRRAMPGIAAVPLRTPDDLDAAAELIAEHVTDVAGEPPPWQVVVSPARGVVKIPRPKVGERVAADQVILEVESRTAAVPVLAGRSGRLVEWLVHDGDPVADGQPLARMESETSP